MNEEFQEVPVISAGKRIGVQWCPWAADWFTSWSPRNSNSNAEGPWDHWVELALRILQDPLTDLVRPEARDAVLRLDVRDYYGEVDRSLTDAELRERFTRKPEGEGGIAP